MIYCLLPWLSQPNLSQIKLSGTVLESSGRADSKTVPGFDNWPRFVGVIEQNKIQRTYEHDCIRNESETSKFTNLLSLIFLLTKVPVKYQWEYLLVATATYLSKNGK